MCYYFFLKIGYNKNTNEKCKTVSLQRLFYSPLLLGALAASRRVKLYATKNSVVPKMLVYLKIRIWITFFSRLNYILMVKNNQ